MALVKEWLSDFLVRHRARFGPHDWPTQGSEEYDEFSRLWLTAFATGQVSESEADAASFRLGSDPPRFRNEHVVKVIEQVKAIRAERGAPSASRLDARERSLSCPHCSGNGICPVYHPDPDPTDRRPESVGAHCVCEHGRWIRRWFGSSDEHRGLLRRIPDFADVLSGSSSWLLESPAFVALMRDVGDGPRFVQDASGSRLVRVNVRSIGRSV